MGTNALPITFMKDQPLEQIQPSYSIQDIFQDIYRKDFIYNPTPGAF